MAVKWIIDTVSLVMGIHYSPNRLIEIAKQARYSGLELLYSPHAKLHNIIVSLGSEALYIPMKCLFQSMCELYYRYVLHR